MVVKTILNNNAIIAADENRKEVVIVKTGIGFARKKGDCLEEGDMEKVFILKEKNISEHMIQLLSHISEEYIEVSKKIVKYGRDNLKAEIHDSIYVTLSDHIELALSRKEKGIAFNNAMNWNIKKTYRDEYHVGEVALRIIQWECGIKLAEEEAGLIALHFVNAEINNDPTVMHDIATMTLFIQKILNFIKYYLGIEYDEDSVEYYRLLRYLQFLSQILFDGKNQQETDEMELDIKVLEVIKQTNKKAFECSNKVLELIKKEYFKDISPEEHLNLVMNISRFIKS